jgi:hypothetical protein
MVMIVESFIDQIHAIMFIVVMGNVVRAFVNVMLVIQEHVVIFHLIFVLVLIVIMERVMKVVVHVQKVIQDRIVTHQF